jgi:hypothetical protein
MFFSILQHCIHILYCTVLWFFVSHLSFSETEMAILGGNDDQENLLDLGEIINLETGRD